MRVKNYRLQKSTITKLTKLLVLFATAIGLNTANAQTHYGLFPSSEVSDAMRIMQTKNENNYIQWTCDQSVTSETRIWLRNSDSKLNIYNQELLELSNLVEIPCLTPNREFKLRKPTSFREMGLSLCDTLQKLNIWLTFKPSGAPDTLFVGVKPGPKHIFNFPTPRIVFHTNKINQWGNFAKGAALSFEAESPIGVNSDMLEFEWYVDGEHMSGRSDRWFETYSRTKWADGKHTISCRYKKKGGTKYSPVGSVEIWQTTTNDHSVRVYPYWGADCTDEENLDSTNFRYNDRIKWGSFVIQPIEEYVHFYMEFLHEDIETSSITNNSKIANFELLNEHDSGKDYVFFDLPTNCKAHAKEPYSPATIYFKLEGKNIHYSLIPFIQPTVKVSPTSLEICENSFETSSSMSIFEAKADGFAEGSGHHYKWYHCDTKNGEYTPLGKEFGNKIMPEKTGYYKVEATDGVYSAWSEPLEVTQRTENCISANIYSKEGKDYACANGTIELHTLLVSPGYTYQWKIGKKDGKNLVDIEGANSDMFYGSVNKPGEAYFIEVKYGSRKVLSKPFAVRQIAKLNPISARKLVTEASPTEVCMDYNTTIKARVTGYSHDTLPIIYNFYQSSILQPILLGTVESSDENVYFSTPVHTSGSSYYVIAVGCDQQLRSDNKMKVNLRNDETCGAGNFYVKKSGDDFKDGTSWQNAFATVTHALEIAKELRKSMLYSNTPIAIHIAAGLYTSDSKEGFEIPDNTTIYGGYDELPVDHTISGTERNPRSPANPNGNATTFYTTSAKERIATVKNNENVKFVGINFVGDKLTTSLDGRALLINNSEVTLDSCWITGFKCSPSSESPLSAVTIVNNNKYSKINTQLNLFNTSLTDNEGGDWGGCLSILTDCDVNIENSTFYHNTNNYKGGAAILSYEASPKVKITNSTFYDNRIVKPGGAFGSSVIRMVGGTPTLNVICSTICDHFYKENGKLNIYNSIVECAGNADVYQNNFPKYSTFKEAEKDNQYNPRAFAANFKGSPFNKMQNSSALTQVLIPSNKLQIVGQAGRPYTQCLYDQRGARRNDIASSFGAYDTDCTVAIETPEEPECVNQTTIANFRSAVTGVYEAKYQWVNNYSDIEGATTDKLEKVGLGTYWLEVKGRDIKGKPVNLRSNEIRISEICETPGDFFVKASGGNDSFSGTTWNKAFATLDQALMMAKEYRQKNGLDKPVTIRMAAGTYKPTYASGFRLDKYAKELQNITIEGGYPENANRQDECKPKCHAKGDGNETILTMNSNKSRLFELSSNVQGVKLKGLHLKGIAKMINPGGALQINGANILLESCWISGFTDGSVTQEGNNTTINIVSTSNVTLKNCYIQGNNARQCPGICINGNGNETKLNLYSTTFHDNISAKNGGSALLVNNGANPSILMINVTMFANRTQSPEYAGCSVIRLAGKNADLRIYQSTIYGTSFNETGKIQLFNSLVEATNASVEKTNSEVADLGLQKVTDDVNLTQHRKFADSFFYTLNLDNQIPVLKLKPDGHEDLIKTVPSIETVDGFDVGTDAIGMPRGSECNMGACQIVE